MGFSNSDDLSKETNELGKGRRFGYAPTNHSFRLNFGVVFMSALQVGQLDFRGLLKKCQERPRPSYLDPEAPQEQRIDHFNKRRAPYSMWPDERVLEVYHNLIHLYSGGSNICSGLVAIRIKELIGPVEKPDRFLQIQNIEEAFATAWNNRGALGFQIDTPRQVTEAEWSLHNDICEVRSVPPLSPISANTFWNHQSKMIQQEIDNLRAGQDLETYHDSLECRQAISGILRRAIDLRDRAISGSNVIFELVGEKLQPRLLVELDIIRGVSGYLSGYAYGDDKATKKVSKFLKFGWLKELTKD